MSRLVTTLLVALALATALASLALARRSARRVSPRAAVLGRAVSSDPSAPSAPPAPNERVQFVLFGMDTTPHWQRRGFEDLYRAVSALHAEGAGPSSYTLFIGTGGFQFDETRRDLSDAERIFQGVLPRHNPVFRYAESLEQIRGKAENVRRLHALGVEIGSHTVRHARGGGWTREAWEHELADHERILDLVSLPRPLGFRAPFLETNEAMYAVLAAHGYRYDASRAQNGSRWPTRHPASRDREHPLWLFGVPSLRIPGRSRPVLLYDLNLDTLLRQAARRAGVEGEEAIVRFENDLFYEAVSAEFERRYAGARAPLLISGHGGFREPTIRFMRRACRLPSVRCTTFREAVEYMDAHPELEGVR